MSMHARAGAAAVCVGVVCAGAAGAHDGAHAHIGFMAGVAHPFTGLDHLLAALALGAWAGRLGGRARSALPGAYVLAGALAGLAAWLAPTPGVFEPLIIGATVALIAFAAFGARAPLGVSCALAAAFAAPHGYAHIAEAGAGAALGPYALGLVLGTAALIAGGFAVAAVTRRGAGGAHAQ